MTSAKPPVKHHYIPQFLLAQWAVNDGKLWRFLRPIPAKIVSKLVAPAEIGYEKHLYATPRRLLPLPPASAVLAAVDTGLHGRQLSEFASTALSDRG